MDALIPLTFALAIGLIGATIALLKCKVASKATPEPGVAISVSIPDAKVLADAVALELNDTASMSFYTGSNTYSSGALSASEPPPEPQEAPEPAEEPQEAPEAPEGDIVADPIAEVPSLPYRAPKSARKPVQRRQAYSPPPRTKTGHLPGMPRGRQGGK